MLIEVTDDARVLGSWGGPVCQFSLIYLYCFVVIIIINIYRAQFVNPTAIGIS